MLLGLTAKIVDKSAYDRIYRPKQGTLDVKSPVLHTVFGEENSSDGCGKIRSELGIFHEPTGS